MNLLVDEAPVAPALRTSFTALGTECLDVLYQHRLMETSQLHRLLTPQAERPVYLRRELGKLMDAGLVQRLRAQDLAPGPAAELPEVRAAQSNRPYVWFLTELGAETVETGSQAPPRPYRVTPESVAGSRQQHTLAVNETGLAFASHAARLGHECGPLDWTPEVAHRIRDGQRRFEDDHLVADAVLRYVDTRRGRTMLTLFLEIDRGTMTTARLAAKIGAYARLYEYVPQHPERARRSAASTRPGWHYSYPVFPRLLIVLDGDLKPWNRPQLAARRLSARLAARTEDLYILTRADPRLARLAGQLSVGVTTLALLRERGPFERIFTPLLRGTPAERPPLTDLYLKT